MYVKEDKSWFKHLDFMLIDLILFESAFILAYYLRHEASFLNSISIYKEMIVAIAAFHLLIAFFCESYRGILRRGYLRELKEVLKHAVALFAGMMGYMMVRKNTGEFSRLTLFIFLGISSTFVFLVRTAYKNYLRKRAPGRSKIQHMILVTSTAQALEMVKKILKNEYGVTRLQGIVLVDEDALGERIQDIPVVSSKKNMYEYARTHIVDEVLIDANIKDMEQMVDCFLCMGITVHINLDSIIKVRKGIVNRVNNISVLTTTINTVTSRQLFLKRCVDIVAGIVGIFVTGVAAVIFGPIIYIQSPGPVFFTQERVGKSGRKFRIIKFRSMYLDAEEKKKELMKQNKMQGLMFKMSDDPRIIPIGKFIRRTSIDELPQFINILKGEMSLVGTRPPTVDEYEKYEFAHKSRLATKPGLTGLWQVSGRSEITDFDDVVKLDNEYIQKWSLGLDIKIIWKTIGVVLRGRGAE